jgi:TM2 domain-containing membrane protein YozV
MHDQNQPAPDAAGPHQWPVAPNGPVHHQAQHPQAPAHHGGQQPPAHGYGYGPGFGGYPPPMVVAPRNPTLMLLASFLIPGLGSILNGETGKGIGILLGYLVSVVLTLVIIGIVGMIGFWIWGMVDAYQGARKWNLRHGIIS